MQNPSEKQVYLLADISSMLYDSTKLKNVRKYATMTTKMVFHGSDIEKICSYYHLNKEDVFRYGIVEKLKEEYILVLYKNYQVTVEKYHI